MSLQVVCLKWVQSHLSRITILSLHFEPCLDALSLRPDVISRLKILSTLAGLRTDMLCAVYTVPFVRKCPPYWDHTWALGIGLLFGSGERGCVRFKSSHHCLPQQHAH